MLSQMIVTFKKNTPSQAKMVQGVIFVLKKKALFKSYFFVQLKINSFVPFDNFFLTKGTLSGSQIIKHLRFLCSGLNFYI